MMEEETKGSNQFGASASASIFDNEAHFGRVVNHLTPELQVDSIICASNQTEETKVSMSPKFIASVGLLNVRRYIVRNEFDDEGIDTVGSRCYPPDIEEDSAFRAKLHNGDSFVAVDSSSNQIVAYCIGIPWHKEPLPINAAPTPENLSGADVYVVHDVAVLPEYRRAGLSTVLLDILSGCARERQLNKMVLYQYSKNI